MRRYLLPLLLAAITVALTVPAQAMELAPFQQRPYWKQVGCSHGHPSKTSKKFLTRTLKNHTPFTKTEGKKVRHFVKCVANRPKAMRLGAKVLKLRKWRARNVCTPAKGNVSLGACMARRDYGWGGAQWNCLYALWSRESGWVTQKANYAGSGAYGIPQALPGSKMGPGWQYDPVVQIRWGLGYIAGRYGTPCGANSFQANNNWY